MLGDEKRYDNDGMFHTILVEELIPANHLLRRIDAVLDTFWIRDEVADLYSDRGRPSWDPEVILRMILLGYLYDLSEVRLVDEVRMHLGYRWFCRLQPSDPVPDRTTLVKLRNEKWKSELWEKLLTWTIDQCAKAGLVSGKHVSIDGTKIKANASWSSLQPIEPPASLHDYLLGKGGWENWESETAEEKTVEPEDDDDEPTPRGGANFRGKSLKNDEYCSRTDPDSLIYRKDDGEGAGLAYIGNICIDTKSRVVLGAEVSPGRTTGEWEAGANLLDHVAEVLGEYPEIVSADKGYGIERFYAEVEARKITPHIPPRKGTRIKPIPGPLLLEMKVLPIDRGKKLVQQRRGTRARNHVLRIRKSRGFRISRRLRLRVENKIGEAKELHGLRRARHRGIGKVDSQIKITAAVMNLKLLASALMGRKTPKAGVVRSSAAFLPVFEGPYLFLLPIRTWWRIPKPQNRVFEIALFPQGF